MHLSPRARHAIARTWASGSCLTRRCAARPIPMPRYSNSFKAPTRPRLSARTGIARRWSDSRSAQRVVIICEPAGPLGTACFELGTQELDVSVAEIVGRVDDFFAEAELRFLVHRVAEPGDVVHQLMKGEIRGRLRRSLRA